MTLTEAAFWTKRVGVILGALVLIFVIVVIFLSNTSNELPPEYLTANYACTETKEDFLEHGLEIPSLQVNSDSENVFELQTDTGRVDSLSELEIINVHKYREREQRLDNQIRAKKIASTLGFDPEAIFRRGTTDYIWTNSSNSRSLNVDARTLNFTMVTDSKYIREVSREIPTPTENEAIALAKNAVRDLQILGSDYNYNDAGNITTQLIDINPDGSYSEAPSLADAELVKVDFHKTKPMISIKENIQNSTAMTNALDRNLGQAKEEEMIINNQRVKVYNYSTVVTYQNPNTSNVSIYVGPKDVNSSTFEEIYRIDFTYWQLEQESCGTYELVSPTYALEKVQSGEGSLVYLNDKNGDVIVDYQPRSVNKYVIYEIALAYYESRTQPAFLQPIYVVSGESVFKNETRGEFHFFYPAINYDIVQDRIELPDAPVDEGSDSTFGL